MKKPEIVIIGAGPAGLGCAWELTQKDNNQTIRVIERNDRVGGLARTFVYKGHFFDIGPHRFFTKNEEVNALWKAILGKDFVPIKRLTRIFYKNKLIAYPIKLRDILIKLGLTECSLYLASFISARITYRKTQPKTFEAWVTKHFGSKLFEIFFKTYTEKIWGISTSKISSEWASQRIRNLDLTQIIKHGIWSSKKRPKSLVDRFNYPTKGAGAMYEKMANILKKRGAHFNLNTTVAKIRHKNSMIIDAHHLFSSMPITEFVMALDPPPPKNVLSAAKKLYYRDHITVNLVISGPAPFPDNWIYIHDPNVLMARVTNYNAFSRRKRGTSAIAVEYFAFRTDPLWEKSDKELIELAKDELEKTGLGNKEKVMYSFVIREVNSYPTYYLGHKKYFLVLKAYLSRFKNLTLIGRGGMYKYNNMDHSIYSGMLAARNYLAGNKLYDIWNINIDADYLEEK